MFIQPSEVARSAPSAANALELRDLEQAIGALPREQREVVLLSGREGKRYEEIAATLGIKLGTVRSRIHRGRAQLRVALEHRRPRQVTPAPRVAPAFPLPQGGPL